MIKPEDIKIELYLTSKQSNQLMQTPKGCRVTHKPTGVTVICEKGRSQHHNRAIAFSLLELVLSEVYLDD